MIRQSFLLLVVSSSVVLFAISGHAQFSTPPATLDDKEAMYNASIEDRTLNIMKVLELNDSAKSNRVHNAIIGHYRALRDRDAAIDAELWNMKDGSNEWEAERMKMISGMSKPLHDKFISELAADLTPEQIEKVKDKMSYGKAEFTYNAYCSILPSLTEAQKSKVMEMLKQAEEEAIDGGSSGEKTAIFQKYKNHINKYLDAQGYDVAKATQEWSAEQELAKKQSGEANSNSIPVVK